MCGGVGGEASGGDCRGRRGAGEGGRRGELVGWGDAPEYSTVLKKLSDIFPASGERSKPKGDFSFLFL